MEMGHTLIVGGTSGAGYALAKRRMGTGQEVSVLGRKAPKETLPRVRVWLADLAKADLEITLKKISRESRGLSNLVFFQRHRERENHWHGELAVSLSATHLVIEHLGPCLAESGGGAIVLVGSMASRFVVEEQPVGYHVVKAAFAGLVRYYAVALGPKSIRVNQVIPCTFIKKESEGYYQGNVSALHEKITPLGRMIRVDDVLNAVDFFCEPKSTAITGQQLVVDGGVSLQGQESLAKKLIQSEKAQTGSRNV
jgi:NAD(P)-dependent dehydrogenase (short-subunit alcohol dehydrogenase family)